MEKTMKIRYIVLGALILSIISSLVTATLALQANRQLTASYNNIKIVIDGDTIVPKDTNGNVVEPFIVDGTTYLPVRAMCEAIGYGVEWDGAAQTVYVFSASEDNSSAKKE